MLYLQGLFLELLISTICEGFFMYHDTSRRVTKVLRVNNGLHYGDWGTPEFCTAGTYATAYDMRIEPPLGGNRDDTSLNAIRLECASLDGLVSGGSIRSSGGHWGDWVGYTYCDNRYSTTIHFLTSFRLQVERPQGGSLINGDDTAANFVAFKCRDFAGKIQPYQIARHPGHGSYGDYGAWSESCDANSAICGINTNVEAKRNDDTALNNVIFYCCSL